ncbi:Crp/Fnr family transcriptional regulator [Polynucleobacter sp. MWH-UH23A]|uniref:Crp/Fnr family transcriptional regulator n=1 Tax=Polynucleobacter sp. MWH-UH23A TaxID=1855613 RepID=UPI0033650722
MHTKGRTAIHSDSSAPCSTCAQRTRCVINKISTKEVGILSSSYISRKSLQEGQYVYRRDGLFTNAYSLRFGAVKSELVFRDGIPQVTHFSVPGEVLGLDGLSSGKYQLDAICLGSVEVCSIPIADVKAMIQSYPEFMSELANALSDLLNISYAHNYDLMNLSSLERVADFLINYSNRLSTVGYDRDHFILPMSRPDLANYLGITVETLSRSLSHLEKINVIKSKNREITFISRSPIFEMPNSITLRERHELTKSGAHSYPPIKERRKP